MKKILMILVTVVVVLTCGRVLHATTKISSLGMEIFNPAPVNTDIATGNY